MAQGAVSVACTVLDRWVSVSNGCGTFAFSDTSDTVDSVSLHPSIPELYSTVVIKYDALSGMVPVLSP